MARCASPCWKAKSNEGKNYYLCLGRHGSDDSELRRQIDSICRQEFAFLGKVLVDSSATSLR